MGTGLHYNYYRTYDPITGRYLERDPIGLLGGVKTYGYVGSNPLMFVDPFGLAELPPSYAVSYTNYYGNYYMSTRSNRSPMGPCKRSFGERVLDRFITTNKAICGVLAPTGLSIWTAKKLAAKTGVPNFTQALNEPPWVFRRPNCVRIV